MSDTNNRTPRTPEEGEPKAPRRKRRRKKRHSIIGTIFKVIGTLFLIGLTTGAILCCFAAVYIRTVIMPNATLDLNKLSVGLNSVMYYTDENGVDRELRTLHGDESRIWVPYSQLPERLIQATVAIEDQRFWTHNGVDWKRTAAAVLYMFTGRDIQGGSTITQQMIKNVTGENQTTVKRKVTEIFKALYVDDTYGKATTLEWYLNNIFMGRKCYGVYTASYMYFGKNINDLTVAEYASLISITNNPSLYDPYTNPENNNTRKNLVLMKMNELGYLTDEEYEIEKNRVLVFTSKPVEMLGEDGQVIEEVETSDYYSWYEEQVITDVTNDLAVRLGISTKVAEDMVLTGGLHIYTCVNPEIQAIAEAIYQDRENFPYESKTGQKLQSAITILDNATGDVVAIVGQVGEKTGDLWRNNATAAYRQPGSSFKPLSVYAPAFDMKLITPITIIDDYPYELDAKGSPYPVNSGTLRFRGLTTIYSALTRSVNTVAFRVLSDMVTPAASFNFVQNRFHIDLVEAIEVGGQIKSDMDRAPLSMGGLTNGVNTRDMAEAFAVFPNEGVYRPSRTYTKVTDSDGNILLENFSVSEKAVEASTAYYINTILQNVVASGTGTNARISGMHVAGKTGSTTSDCDRWFAGYTPYYTAVVWSGYDNPERITAPSGTNPSAVIWQKVMSQIHADLEDKNFFSPSNLVTVQYCLDSGMLATDACRNDARGSRAATMSLLRDDAPTGFCTLHSEASTVTVCVDDPIEGTSGLYHLAGEFCPEESLRTYTLVDYQREVLGTTTADDTAYLLDFTLQAGACTVHTEPEPEPEPEPYDPYDPNNPYNPYDPNTPYDPNNPYNPGDPGGGFDPDTPFVQPQQPSFPSGESPGTSPDPGSGPGDEPFLPVGR